MPSQNGSQSAWPTVPSRAEVVQTFQANGGRVAAVLPVHQPRALLRAFNILPMEIWGPPGTDTTAGDARLQAYTCSLARAGYAFLASGAVPVDVVVVPHACDTMQGLGSLLLDLAPPAMPVLPFYLPRAQGAVAVEFLARELKTLAARLEKITGRPLDEAALAQANEREERADAALAELFAARARLPASDAEFYALARSREFLPAEEFEPLARTALAAATDEAPRGLPVLFSGIVPEPPGLFEALAQAGLRIAADDFACTGRRLYRPQSDADPFRRLAAGLLSGAPDTTRCGSVDERVVHLRDLAARSGARAAVFLAVKFCEPEHFQLPQVRRALEAAGLRSIEIEIDPVRPLPDQVLTRLEAFAESLA